jgi:hypothetical protein
MGVEGKKTKNITLIKRNDKKRERVNDDNGKRPRFDLIYIHTLVTYFMTINKY